MLAGLARFLVRRRLVVLAAAAVFLAVCGTIGGGVAGNLTGGGVDTPEAAPAGVALTEELAAEDSVADVASYWTLQAPPLVSTDGTQALVLAASWATRTRSASASRP